MTASFWRCGLFAAALSLCGISAAMADSTQTLTHFFQDAVTLHASFRQTVLDEGLNTLEESSGEMWIKRPGQFRWDYKQPGQQQIISDGNKVWIYDQDLEQVTVKQLDKAISDAPAMLLAGKGDISSRFNITPLGQQGKLDWLELTPKQNTGEFSHVQIGFEGENIRTLQLTDQFEQTTRITFENNEVNGLVSNALFSFEIPENVDIFEVSE